MRFAVFAASLAARTTLAGRPGEQDPATRQITVGPVRVGCAAVVPQRFVAVDDELFYDTIEEFTHVGDRSHVLKIEGRRVCVNWTGAICPVDASAFCYARKRAVPQNEVSKSEVSLVMSRLGRAMALCGGDAHFGQRNNDCRASVSGKMKEISRDGLQTGIGTLPATLLTVQELHGATTHRLAVDDQHGRGA